MSELKNKTIITVATTGAWPTKANNPNVPMTPEEISEDVYACWKAGAAIAHLHMRDDEGHGTMDKEKFRKTVELLRANHPDCDIILNMTTSGDIHADDTTRQIHLKELRPEMGSYDCGSMNWLHTSLFLNPPAFLEELGKNMQEWGVKPEIEAFDPGMIANAAYYLKKGVLKAPLHFQFCMGCANGIPGSLKNLIFMKETMESLCPGSTWSCFGVGHCALEMLYGAVALGGHIRVGMEDNVMYAKGVLAESNVQFVERARRVIEGVRQAGRHPRRGPRDPQPGQVKHIRQESPAGRSLQGFPPKRFSTGGTSFDPMNVTGNPDGSLLHDLSPPLL